MADMPLPERIIAFTSFGLVPWSRLKFRPTGIRFHHKTYYLEVWVCNSSQLATQLVGDPLDFDRGQYYDIHDKRDLPQLLEMAGPENRTALLALAKEVWGDV